MEVKDSCMTYPWTLLWPHDIMLLHLMSLTQNKHVCRRHWRERQRCLSAKLWPGDGLSVPAVDYWACTVWPQRCWLVRREASPSYSHLSLNVDQQTLLEMFHWNKQHFVCFSETNWRRPVNTSRWRQTSMWAGGPFLENSGGREAAVGVGMGSWQQFRCLLIMCQLLRWTRGRTRRGPRPRFITINKQRSHLACICDSGVTQRLQKRCRVLVQWVRNPTKVI